MIDHAYPTQVAGTAAVGLAADDEPATVRLAQDGSERAFAALYERYAARVYRFGLVRTGQVSDAEDLVQQTFLRVVESLPRYQDRGLPFGAWVFSIARHALADRRRSLRPWATLSPDDPGPAVNDHAPAAIEYAVLREALGRITHDQRDVIVYRFFSDLSVRETARLMRRDEGAVRNLQARALAALRRVLAGDAEVIVSLRERVPT